MKKIILILISLIHIGHAQQPLVLADNGAKLSPTAAAPLSASQLEEARGNAFLARRNGKVFLVTAAHVADALGLRYRKVSDDIACLDEWPEAAFPNAAAIPEIAPYREHVPIVLRSWSLTKNVPVELKLDAKPFTHDMREWAKSVKVASGTISLDYWQSREFEHWADGAASFGDCLLGPGCSGSLILQDGKAVGVLSAGNLIKGREQEAFQLLVPAPRPRGLPGWAG